MKISVVEDPFRYYVNGNYIRPDNRSCDPFPPDFVAAFGKAVDAIARKNTVETLNFLRCEGGRKCRDLRGTRNIY
jgi:hypothetical protein